MDASDDFGESQATQLLQNVLESGHDVGYRSSDSRSTRHGGAIFSKDASADSALSRATVPHYNLHGLEQTQTQLVEDSEMGDSQKENLHNSRQNALHARPPSPPQSPPAASPSRRSGTRGAQVVQKPKSRDRKAVSKPPSRSGPVAQKNTGAVPKTPNRPSGSPPRDYSSPLTEDDFDHDSFVAQAARQRQLAGLKQFGVPLSDLEKGPHSFSADITSSPDVRMNTHRRPTSRNKPRRSPTPEGRILVDATPEHSVCSESFDRQPNLAGDTQEAFVPKRNNDDDTESDASGPSSSYGRMLNGEYEPEPEMDPTQPTTQPNSDLDLDRSPQPVLQTLTTTAAMSNATTNATTGRRNILGLVNPLKQWRFRNPANIPSTDVQNDYSTQAAPTQQSSFPPFRGPVNEETQPSNIPEELANLQPRRTFPKTPVAQRLPQSPTDRVAAGLLLHLKDPQGSDAPDAMDVIPDSEPMRDEGPTRASTRARSASTTPSKSRQGSKSPNKRRKLDTVEEVAATESEPDDQHSPEPVRREEEEEEEEAEVPLASRIPVKVAPPMRPTFQVSRFDPGITPTPYIHSTRNIAHSKPRASPKDKPKPRVEEPEPISKPIVYQSKRAAQGRSAETAEVPSSVPDQDVPSAKAKGKGRAVATKVTTSRAGKTTKRVSTRGATKKVTSKGKRRRVIESEDEDDDDEELSNGDDEMDLLPRVQEEDEPAEEEYIEPKLEEAGPSSSRKRKRVTTAPSKVRASSKGSTRAKSALPEPPAKYLRSAAHNYIGRHPQTDDATRVLALWNNGTRANYFAGTVHSLISESTYNVIFDDGDSIIIPITSMRKLELRKGDEVLLGSSRAFVEDLTRVDSEGIVIVAREKQLIDVELKDVRLVPRTVDAHWKDRTLTAAEILPLFRPASTKNEPQSPTHSVATGSVNRAGRKALFKGVAIVVTLGNNEGEVKRKQELEQMMTQHGGTVLSDWSFAIRMEGKHSNSNHRWVATQSDLSWTGKSTIEQAFLVCDQPSQKPKFLTALALGIPCLHDSWLRESIAQNEILPFPQYLVSQGFNPTLNAVITQQVDTRWGETTSYLTDIASYGVPAKSFRTKSILCLGSDIFPSPKAKKNANEAANAITQIILCMGAERVEAATEVRYASRKPHDYDYVIVKDHPRTSLKSPNVAAWDWVKNCLTASRLNPITPVTS
ncbi:hypothetical protein BDN72DRAFT_808621 [Pluteus cervinus]|uniref:Uncharacterized protein n=1 Tax=Pluteus cervinus TaxID=181527 RepID=A0ACD3BD59_9AGAR|nr:hypothetical protein BDN72DRAFT_808621 [Pluteus cervinus]